MAMIRALTRGVRMVGAPRMAAAAVTRMTAVRTMSGVPVKFTDAEKASMMAELNEWSAVDGRDAIQRQYLFEDFKQAFAFMTRVATFADDMNHHPEWFNVYNRIDVTLSTHDCGGLSKNDLELARFMDSCFTDDA